MMQDQYQEATARFAELFERKESNLNGQKTHPWHLLKRDALEDVRRIGFPGRKNENWKYTPVTKLLSATYSRGTMDATGKRHLESHPLRGIDGVAIVFVNGSLDRELSQLDALDPEIRVVDLKALDQESTDIDLVKASYTAWQETEDTGFPALNLALSESAIFFDVPDGHVPSKPIHIIHINAHRETPVISNPLLFFRIGSQADLTVLESMISAGRKVHEAPFAHFANVARYFHLASGANASHYNLQLSSTGEAIVNNTRVIQARDSHYRNFNVDLGGKLVRNNLYIRHLSTGITTDLYGIYLANGSQHLDTQSFIDHAFPHCQSNELYKGIVGGQARAVFNGKIIVRQDAQKTNAFQQNSNLLLSDEATIDTKPQLEIFADDVRCSHGATIGQLDEQALYYLKTRGLNDSEARSMLQHAFIREVLDKFAWDSLRKRVEKLVRGKFVLHRIEQGSPA